MSVFQYLFCTDINRGVREYQATPGAVLLDVRSREEYVRRHIEESVSLPLSELDRAGELVPDRDTPLYVYAYGGESSARAASRKSGRPPWGENGMLERPATRRSPRP